MHAKVFTCAVVGLDGVLVEVEVVLAPEPHRDGLSPEDEVEHPSDRRHIRGQDPANGPAWTASTLEISRPSCPSASCRRKLIVSLVCRA